MSAKHRNWAALVIVAAVAGFFWWRSTRLSREAGEIFETMDQTSEIKGRTAAYLKLAKDERPRQSEAWWREFQEAWDLYASADAEWWARYEASPHAKRVRMANERVARQRAEVKDSDHIRGVRQLNKVVREILKETQ